MAVQEQTPYIEHVANGVTTSFTLGFVCDSADMLVVTVNDLPTNVGDWSFIEGSVIFQYPPLSESIIKIWRNSPLARSTTFKTYDNSLNPNSLNLDLDKIWLVMQELNVKNFISDNKLQELLDKLVDGDINGLPAEVLARIAGDESIKSLVNLEAIRAYQAESNLSVRIDNESLLANQNILAEKQRAEAAEQGLQIQVNSVGVGNKAYKTYALMDADKTNIPAKSKVTVTNDETASNNGDWQFDGSVFTKSTYDPLTQSKKHTDDAIEKEKITQFFSTKSELKDLLKIYRVFPSTVLLVANNGTTTESASWSTTDFIPVVKDEFYQLYAQASSSVICLAAYDANKNFISSLYTPAVTSDQIRNIKIPAGISFIRMCYLTANPSTYLKPMRSKLSNMLIDTTYINDALFNQINLVNASTVTAGKYLSNNVAIDSGSFSYTDYIPVTPLSSYVTNGNGLAAGATLEWYRSGVHYYDENKNYLGHGVRVEPNISFKIPENCYFIRLNFISTTTPASVLKVVKGDSIFGDPVTSKIKDFMKTFDEDDILALYGYTTGKYISTAGVETVSGNWAATDFIAVDYQQKISYQAEASSIVSVISGYDENKNFVRSLVNGAGSLAISLGELDIPDNISFIRFSFYWVNNQQKLRNIPVGSGGGGGEPASNISRYNGKTWLAMGTSIVDSQSTPYTYPVWVRDYFGFTLYDHAISGTRVRACLQRATASIDARITASDIITIDHGTNDFKIETPMGTINDAPTTAANLKDPAYRDNTNTSGTFYGDLKGVIEYIYSVKPSARIHLITPIRRTAPAANGTDTNNLGLKLVDYRDAIVAVAKYYGLPLLDNYYESGFNDKTIPVWTADGLHPTEWAQKNVMTNKVIGFIESN